MTQEEFGLNVALFGAAIFALALVVDVVRRVVMIVRCAVVRRWVVGELARTKREDDRKRPSVHRWPPTTSGGAGAAA